MKILKILDGFFVLPGFMEFLRELDSLPLQRRKKIARHYWDLMSVYYAEYRNLNEFNESGWAFSRADIRKLKSSLREIKKKRNICHDLDEKKSLDLCEYTFRAFTWSGYEHEIQAQARGKLISRIIVNCLSLYKNPRSKLLNPRLSKT